MFDTSNLDIISANIEAIMDKRLSKFKLETVVSMSHRCIRSFFHAKSTGVATITLLTMGVQVLNI